MNKRNLNIMSAVTFVLMIVINVVSTFGLFNVTPVKEISDKYTNLLVPMGYTFSVIWTVIYAGLLYYTIKELVGKEDHYNIGWLYMISNVLNILWIITFSAKFYLLSCVIIAALLVTLYTIQSRITKTNLTKIIFSIYTAWILVATIVNITTFIISTGLIAYNSTLMKVASVLMLVGTTFVILINYDNIAMKLTYVFALFGIVLNHIIKFNAVYPIMFTLVMLVILLILFTLFAQVLRNSKGACKNEVV